jgi:hypothetical protein
LHDFARSILALPLTKSMSPALGQYLEYRLCQRLEFLWPTLQALGGTEPDAWFAVLAEIADGLDVLGIDTPDMSVVAAEALLRGRLKEEAVISGQAVLGKILVQLLDNGPTLLSDEPVLSQFLLSFREQRALIHQLRHYRQQAANWRAYSAQTLEHLTTERRKSAELLRLSTASQPKPSAVPTVARTSGGSTQSSPVTPEPADLPNIIPARELAQ